jgi:uncharacterized membrane protein YuzA (DUF378 family)
MEIIQTVAIILAVIGAINWGLVGLFNLTWWLSWPVESPSAK